MQRKDGGRVIPSAAFLNWSVERSLVSLCHLENADQDFSNIFY